MPLRIRIRNSDAQVYSQSLLKFGIGLTWLIPLCEDLRRPGNCHTTRDMEIGKAATLVMLQPSALCERAYSVDTCTVAALDAIAAFASQTPAPPRRVSRFFRVWLPHRSPCRADHSAYFGLANFISPILSAVDADQAKQSRERCQRETQAENEISVNGNVENAVRFRSLRPPSSFPFCPTPTLRAAIRFRASADMVLRFPDLWARLLLPLIPPTSLTPGQRV